MMTAEYRHRSVRAVCIAAITIVLIAIDFMSDLWLDSKSMRKGWDTAATVAIFYAAVWLWRERHVD